MTTVNNNNIKNEDNKNTSLSTNRITETWTTWSTGKTNALSDYIFIKVYNPSMGSDADKELDGYIVKMWENWWEAFDKELKWIKVLDLTKCYKWYTARLENGKPVLDENGKAKTDVYFTPEVSVYDKSNITLAKSTEDWPVVLGKGWFKSYIDFTTSMQLPDWTINPLFGTIGTNTKTWEKYPISIMKQETYLYFELDWELFKLRLWASYWRWKDVKEGTFLFAKDKGSREFMKQYGWMRFEFHYLTLDAKVMKADSYKYIEWTFNSITSESVIDNLNKTREAITNLNTNNFQWVSLANWMESIQFDINRKLLEMPSEKKELEEKESDTEISVEDIPF